MRTYEVTETATGWDIVDPSTSAVLGSYASVSDLCDGLVDILARPIVQAASISFEEGDV